MAEKSSMIKLGGLWKGKTSKGGDYLSGSVTYGSTLLIFKNSYKKDGDKDPDYIAYLAPKDKQENNNKAEVESEEDVPF